MPLCLDGLLYKWRLPLVARRPPQHVLVLDTGKNLAHLRLLVVMHGYEVVDVVEVHRPGSPRRPLRRVCLPSGALDLDDSDFSGGFCGRGFRPSCLAWRASQAPPALACHCPMQARISRGTLLCSAGTLVPRNRPLRASRSCPSLAGSRSSRFRAVLRLVAREPSLSAAEPPLGAA